MGGSRGSTIGRGEQGEARSRRLADAWRAGAAEPADRHLVGLLLGPPLDDPAGLREAAEAWSAGVATVEEAVQLLAALRELLLARTGLPRTGLCAAVDSAAAAAAGAIAGRGVQAALTDPLTGLATRRVFDQLAPTAVAQATRHGRPLSVVMTDLDGLKQVNDTQGHGAGDEMLAQFAAALRSGLRGSDSAYRFGGDEFVLLLPDSSADDTRRVVDRIREAAAPTFSWGCAECPAEATDAGAALALADQRLYQSRDRARPQAAAPSFADRRRTAVLVGAALVVSVAGATLATTLVWGRGQQQAAPEPAGPAAPTAASAAPTGPPSSAAPPRHDSAPGVATTAPVAGPAEGRVRLARQQPRFPASRPPAPRDRSSKTLPAAAPASAPAVLPTPSTTGEPAGGGGLLSDTVGGVSAVVGGLVGGLLRLL